MLNVKIVMAGAGCNKDVAEKWLNALQTACDRHGIKTKRAIAAFLANIGVESSSLQTLVENLNYSAQGLAATWPSLYMDKTTKQPNSLAKEIARKPELIANHTYANRMGNGPVESGDGWKYRGRGLIQTTGKANYLNYSKAAGVDAVSNPDLLLEPEHAANSAAIFFAKNGCIQAADSGDFARTVKLINGAAPNPANHGALRSKRYQDALEAFA